MNQFHNLRISRIAQETRDAIAVSLEVPEGIAAQFNHVQGQHLTLRMAIDGNEVRRSYSICSAVGERPIRIAIKRVSGGNFSNWANENLAVGQQLEVLAPSGHFHVALEADAARHYVAFAAGSGITPILSIIKTTLAREPGSRFTLFYGNRASSSVIFKEELEDLKDAYMGRFSLTFVLSREQQDIDLFNGRIDGPKVDAILTSWMDVSEIDYAFVCGPWDMMESVSAALIAHGLDKSRVKMELFATSVAGARKNVPVHRIAGENVCEVTVIQDGRTRQFSMKKNDESVLDAALSQGLELPYSCKAGVCSTCRCKRTEGEVDMDVNFALEDYEVARGFMLTCQSFPVSDRLTLDFDSET